MTTRGELGEQGIPLDRVAMPVDNPILATGLLGRGHRRAFEATRTVTTLTHQRGLVKGSNVCKNVLIRAAHTFLIGARPPKPGGSLRGLRVYSQVSARKISPQVKQVPGTVQTSMSVPHCPCLPMLGETVHTWPQLSQLHLVHTSRPRASGSSQT